MPNHNSVDRPDLGAWQAESLRTTSFPSSNMEFNVSDWWQDLVGEEPENRNLRPKERFQRDEGRFDGFKLTLGNRPIRIDWVASPSDVRDEFWIGPFQDSLEPFLELMSRWFRISPPIRRLAFGAVLMQPVDDLRTGYELIAKYLPNITLDPDGSSDFSYQINRRRDSLTGIEGLRINRLSKWSVAKRGTTRIALSPKEARASFFPTSETYACRLELDINTTPDYQADLPHDQLAAIFQELVDLGKEIAIEGDIP